MNGWQGLKIVLGLYNIDITLIVKILIELPLKYMAIIVHLSKVKHHRYYAKLTKKSWYNIQRRYVSKKSDVIKK